MADNAVTREMALHLFAKQASAEGIDLSNVNEQQFQSGFEAFQQEILPEMLANGGNPVLPEGAEDQTGKVASAHAGGGGAEEEPSIAEKIAAAQNALAWNAFLKVAEAENFDVAGLLAAGEEGQKKVAEVYGHFLVNGVPQLFEREKQAAAEKEAAAQAERSLAEVTVMGRHFGDVAFDHIMGKLASAGLVQYTPRFAKQAEDEECEDEDKKGKGKDGKKPMPPQFGKGASAGNDFIEAIAAQRAHSTLVQEQGDKAASGSLEDAVVQRTQEILALYRR